MLGGPEHGRPKANVIVDFEWEIDGDFTPCGGSWGEPCGDTKRVIRYHPENHGKDLRCTNDHHHDFEGKTFIPAEEFGPDGVFFNILPDALVPNGAKVLATRWKISKKTESLLAHITSCEMCSTEEFNTYNTPDPAMLWEWLKEYAPELHKVVQDELRSLPGFEFRHWVGLISATMQKRIRIRVDKSILVYDHGVPRKIGNRIWSNISRSARMFLQEALVFRICRRCNEGKGSRLPLAQDLMQWYANRHFQGSIPAAKADEHWETFDEIMRILYATGERAG